MNEMLFIIITIVIPIVIFIVIDYFRFNLQISKFVDATEELSAMSNIALETMKNGKYDIEFQGKIFYVYAQKGDWRSLLLQIETSVNEVQVRYDNIDKYYFLKMDKELYSFIATLHEDLINIENEIRILKWKYGLNRGKK